MTARPKITTGSNDRPKDDTIAQTGPGLPDDTSRPVEATDDQIKHAKESLRETPRQKLKREVDEEIELSQKGAE
ncbi:hypothetical protein [Mesorhizobium sp. 1B3]|uniref:hypothetical protein n=1 Tax=Mesorhizobium sp. 1B3 TaxID=3243599 RepID=UPI003D971ADE